jgi:ribosomal protein S12 methylthiotransferase accessory factor
MIDLDLGAHAVVAMGRHSRPGEPALVIAAAADVDAAAACRRALKELSANRLNVRYEMTQPGAAPEPDPETVLDERAHGQLYARADTAERLDFWWSAPQCVPLPPADAGGVTTAIRRCVAAIARAGLEVVVVELTAPAMASLGLRTVKVLVPGAYPMLFDGRYPHFGGRRITQAPVAAGLRDTPLPFEELCTFPHPFP